MRKQHTFWSNPQLCDRSPPVTTHHISVQTRNLGQLLPHNIVPVKNQDVLGELVVIFPYMTGCSQLTTTVVKEKKNSLSRDNKAQLPVPSGHILITAICREAVVLTHIKYCACLTFACRPVTLTCPEYFSCKLLHLILIQQHKETQSNIFLRCYSDIQYVWIHGVMS